MVLLALRPEGKTFSPVASHQGIYEGSHISLRGRKYNSPRNACTGGYLPVSKDLEACVLFEVYFLVFKVSKPTFFPLRLSFN